MWSVVLFALIPAAVGQTTFSTSNWKGILHADSGVLQSLKPKSDVSFDFSPSDYFPLRNGVGNYHTGDLTLRWRTTGQAKWHELDTAAQRATSPKSTESNSTSILISNFDNVFPEAAKSFSITRSWAAKEGDIILSATLTNKNSSEIEIGAFGFPIEFNNIFTNRTADETTAKCVLADPYIGLDAGYLQATRLTGTGPNLLATPYGNNSRFEAWRFLEEDQNQPTGYQTQVFEGLYAWQTLSKAYAEQEWNATEPWNVPTSATLKPGESVVYAIRIGLSETNHEIESTVASQGMPVAVGVPGYILPTDLDGQLFLNSTCAVQSITTDPDGMLTFSSKNANSPAWKAYDVKATPGAYGRVRATIQYNDGRVQTVQYYVTDTALNTSTKFADFLFEKQWYADTSDSFHRAPSVISYDDEVEQMILQESRAWIAGISDEGGAGSFEAAAMKSAIHPDVNEVLKLEEMVNTTVWGWLQDVVTDNATGSTEYGVKRSLFFYDPAALPDFQYDPSIDWGVWSAWNKSEAFATWRAYDYVHVSVLYWALYSAERASPGILTVQNATWYLTQAYKTVIASQVAQVQYSTVGLMCETIWLYILQALQTEKLTEEFDTLQAAMKKRQELWSTQSEPFGSEMAWDSTGQEGVYLWSKYFNDSATVTKTLNSIRGYMPTVAHWGWNGNARRYWDFLYAGKLQRIERMIHHYGSGLNALPLLDAYKYNTDPSSAAALHDLRVGYGGNMGPLTNIHADGFGAMAFHSFPDTMKWDAYSGDYGPNYLGHVAGACTFLVEHPDFGWLSFGGNLQQNLDIITVQPRDTVRRRIYVAALGLAIEIDAGAIREFVYNASAKTLMFSFEQAGSEGAQSATMVYKDTLSSGVQMTTIGLHQQRGGYAVSLPGLVKFSVA